VRCEILQRYRDEQGQELVVYHYGQAICIESTEGASEFTIPAI